MEMNCDDVKWDIWPGHPDTFLGRLKENIKWEAIQKQSNCGISAWEAIFVGLLVNQLTDLKGCLKGNMSLSFVWPTALTVVLLWLYALPFTFGYLLQKWIMTSTRMWSRNISLNWWTCDWGICRWRQSVIEFLSCQRSLIRNWVLICRNDCLDI